MQAISGCQRWQPFANSMQVAVPQNSLNPRLTVGIVDGFHQQLQLSECSCLGGCVGTSITQYSNSILQDMSE